MDDPLHRFAETGDVRPDPEAVGRLPRDLRRLLHRAGLTFGQVADLFRRTGAVSAGDLAAALLDDGPGTGLPEDVAAILARALEQRQLRAGRRLDLGRAHAIARTVLELVPDPDSGLQPVGSLRRAVETVGDVQLLGRSRDPAGAIEAIVQGSGIQDVLHRGPAAVSVVIRDEQVDVRFVQPARYGFALIHYTGSAAHNRALRRLAAARGGRLLADRLVVPEGPIGAHDEREAYAALGLPFIAPELREGTGELEAARDASLPRLLERCDIRGDLHMHTNRSDGRDPLAAMVRAARALGYEYVAITDHSQSAACQRVVDSDDLARQADEIARIREEVEGIAILHGTESEILPDGRLDFPDNVLERLDIVLASLHEHGGDSPARLTERFLTAVRHPLVNVITHPLNRIVGRRAPYEFDLDRVTAAAAETGTALEVDGAPLHLDLDGASARRAVAAGVMLAVDSDSHGADRLDLQMDLAVRTARRGWAESRHVLNTRSLDDLRAFVARKRRA